MAWPQKWPHFSSFARGGNITRTGKGEILKTNFETWALEATDAIKEQLGAGRVESEVLPNRASWTYAGNRGVASPDEAGILANFVLNGGQPRYEYFLYEAGGASAGAQIAGKLIGP